MATPLSDALDKLVAHIQPIATELGIREINKYPKALMERVNPPVIDLVLMNDNLMNRGQGSSLIIQHAISFRLFFYSQPLTANSKFDDCLLKLEAIQDYLLNHLSVDNGYGDLGISDSDAFEGLGVTMGEIFGSGEAYVGGYIDLNLKVLTTY